MTVPEEVFGFVNTNGGAVTFVEGHGAVGFFSGADSFLMQNKRRFGSNYNYMYARHISN